jgi:16S rRNA (guanine527-N7)-methyltransferase
LRAALRETGSTATIINARIELVPPLAADVLSARALAELATLLGYAKRHMTAAGTAIFAKGASWKSEVSKAKSVWNFECAAINSTLDAEAAILNITGVSRA